MRKKNLRNLRKILNHNSHKSLLTLKNFEDESYENRRTPKF